MPDSRGIDLYQDRGRLLSIGQLKAPIWNDKDSLKLIHNLFLRYLLKRIILNLSSVVEIVTCQL